MNPTIRSILLGSITGNCYLLKSGSGFFLIDTGRKAQRLKLEQELKKAGCYPGNLKLIILTHGDFDHTGNCIYLREKYNASIVMHALDTGMVETGDMFYNRKNVSFLIKTMVNFFFKITRFKPDFTIDEGDTLAEFGLEAQIIHIPGHSAGSIGILTEGGDFFCGDLFTNTDKPELNTMIYDSEAAQKSIEKIKSLQIQTLYPGHGTSFSKDQLFY